MIPTSTAPEVRFEFATSSLNKGSAYLHISVSNIEKPYGAVNMRMDMRDAVRLVANVHSVLSHLQSDNAILPVDQRTIQNQVDHALYMNRIAGVRPLLGEAPSLAAEVYEYIYSEFDAFEENEIGADLAYLMGAILRNHKCEWSFGRAIVESLSKKYPDKDHLIWKYIDIV